MRLVLRVLYLHLALFLLLAAPGFAAKSTSQNKVGPTLSLRGYCCVEGTINPSDEGSCLKQNGHYSSDKKSLEKSCRAGQPKISPLFKKEQPLIVRGYCCTKGEVSSTTKEECVRNKGFFSESKTQTVRTCKQTRGYCCVEGTYTTQTMASCEKLKGMFFLDRQKGYRVCQETKGFCCDGGDVSSATKGACDKKRGSFSVARGAAEQSCLELMGYCCIDETVSPAQKQRCDRLRGIFFSTMAEAAKACKTAASPGAKEKNKAGSTLGTAQRKRRTLEKSPRLQMLPDLVVENTELDSACLLKVTVKNQGGAIAVKDHAQSELHISAGPGNTLEAGKRYLRVIDPHGKLLKAGGSVSYTTDLQVSGRQATMVWLDTRHHITERDERNNGDDQEVVCKSRLQLSSKGLIKAPGKPKSTGKKSLTVKPLARTRAPTGSAQKSAMKTEGGMVASSQGAVRSRAPLAFSELPIEILSPRPDIIIQPGEEITVRYRVTIPTDPGDVEFSLIGEEGITVARTFNRYEPPEIPDLSGAELTEVGTGLLGGESETEEGEAFGMGDVAFVWRLPETLIPERTYHIEALKGTLRGRSGTLRVHTEEDLLEPEFVGVSGLRVSLAGGSRVRHPGETVRAYVDIVGSEEIAPFWTPEAYRAGVTSHGLYFRPRLAGREPVGTWIGPSFNVISRSPDMRSLTIDLRLPEAGSYSGYDDTDEFVLTFIHEGRRASSAMFNVRPEGHGGGASVQILEPGGSAVWAMNTEQPLSFRLYGLDDPESLYFVLYLLNGDSEWTSIRTGDLSCDWTTGICSMTVSVSGDRIQSLADALGGGSGARLRVVVKRGSFRGPELARTDSSPFAITVPSVEVLSPIAGSTFNLFEELTVRLRIRGGAQGPFTVRLDNPSRRSSGGASFTVYDVECSTCPSASAQEITVTELIRLVGDTGGYEFIDGMDGWVVRVSSESEPEVRASSEEFSIGLPGFRVLNPDSADVFRNGETRSISWEIEIPPSEAGWLSMVDIDLRNEDRHPERNFTLTIAENVRTDNTSGRYLRGRYRWRVGEVIHNPGGLDHGRLRDLEPGRYTIRVRLRNNLHVLKDRSSVFRIE